MSRFLRWPPRSVSSWPTSPPTTPTSSLWCRASPCLPWVDVIGCGKIHCTSHITGSPQNLPQCDWCSYNENTTYIHQVFFFFSNKGIFGKSLHVNKLCVEVLWMEHSFWVVLDVELLVNNTSFTLTSLFWYFAPKLCRYSIETTHIESMSLTYSPVYMVLCLCRRPPPATAPVTWWRRVSATHWGTCPGNSRGRCCCCRRYSCPRTRYLNHLFPRKQ